MKSFAGFILFSCVIATTLAVKCYVCSSKKVSSDAKEDYKNQNAFSLRTCQKDPEGCDTTKFDVSLTIEQYYLGDDCENFDKKNFNESTSKNIVDCQVGCAFIKSEVFDRKEDKSRITRQCAYYDKDVVGSYMSADGLKRTGTGSDKVLNKFWYCNTDYCNGGDRVNGLAAVSIAVFYALVALYY